MSFETQFSISLFANIPLLVIVLAIIMQRIFELRLAKKNYQIALQNGAQEYGAGHYPLFVVLHTLWLIGVLVESWRACDADALWLHPQQLVMAVMCVVALALAEILRYWAIASLGTAWNTRIIVVPGAQRVTKGAYKYFKHPNYIAVVVELAAVPLMFGAWKTALFASIANACLLLFIRIPAENHALQEFLHEKK